VYAKSNMSKDDLNYWGSNYGIIICGKFGEKSEQMKERVGSMCAQALDIPEDLPSTSSVVQVEKDLIL